MKTRAIICKSWPSFQGNTAGGVPTPYPWTPRRVSRAWTDSGGILPRSTETSGRTIRMILWEPPTLWRRPSPTAKSRRRQRRSSTRNLNSRRTGYKWRFQRVPVLLFSKSNQISLQSILYEWFTLKIHDYVRQDTRIHWSSFQSITIFFISSNRVDTNRNH